MACVPNPRSLDTGVVNTANGPGSKNIPETQEDWKLDIVQEIFGEVGLTLLAVESHILMHGRVYVTDQYLCFYSNLFGLEKKIRIPYSHITCMSKENTALVIPNAISISTESKSYLFRSFWDRDDCYNLLCEQITKHNTTDDDMTRGELDQEILLDEFGNVLDKNFENPLSPALYPPPRSAKTIAIQHGSITIGTPDLLLNGTLNGNGNGTHNGSAAAKTPSKISGLPSICFTKGLHGGNGSGGLGEYLPDTDGSGFSYRSISKSSSGSGSSSSTQILPTNNATNTNAVTTPNRPKALTLPHDRQSIVSLTGLFPSSAASSPVKPLSSTPSVECGIAAGSLKAVSDGLANGTSNGVLNGTPNGTVGASPVRMTLPSPVLRDSSINSEMSQHSAYGAIDGSCPDFTSTSPELQCQLEKHQEESRLRQVVIRDFLLNIDLKTFVRKFILDDAEFSYKRFHEEHKDRDVECTVWTGDPNDPDVGCSRELRFVKPINLMSMPFSRAKKLQRYRQYGSLGMIVSGSTRLEDVPYADCFTVEDVFVVRACGPRQLKCELSFEVRFMKTVMFKSMIESSTNPEMVKWQKLFIEETKQSVDRLTQRIHLATARRHSHKSMHSSGGGGRDSPLIGMIAEEEDGPPTPTKTQNHPSQPLSQTSHPQIGQLGSESLLGSSDRSLGDEEGTGLLYLALRAILAVPTALMKTVLSFVYFENQLLQPHQQQQQQQQQGRFHPMFVLLVVGSLVGYIAYLQGTLNNVEANLERMQQSVSSMHSDFKLMRDLILQHSTSTTSEAGESLICM